MVEIKGSFGTRHVKSAGGLAEFDDIEKVIRIVDASRVAGKEHVVHSAKLALDSLERGRSFADSPSIELTCWVAGLRQINKSLERVGINEDSREIAVVVVGDSSSKVDEAIEKIFEELGIVREDQVLEIDDEKIETIKEAFSISESQLKVSPLKDIILEKVALLSLEQ